MSFGQRKSLTQNDAMRKTHWIFHFHGNRSRQMATHTHIQNQKLREHKPIKIIIKAISNWDTHRGCLASPPASGVSYVAGCSRSLQSNAIAQHTWNLHHYYSCIFTFILLLMTEYRVQFNHRKSLNAINVSSCSCNCTECVSLVLHAAIDSVRSPLRIPSPSHSSSFWSSVDDANTMSHSAWIDWQMCTDRCSIAFDDCAQTLCLSNRNMSRTSFRQTVVAACIRIENRIKHPAECNAPANVHRVSRSKTKKN